MVTPFTQTALVMDLGSHALKAGLSGEENPSIVFESVLAVPKYSKILSSDRIEALGRPPQFLGMFHLKRIFEDGIFLSEDYTQTVLSKVLGETESNQAVRDTPFFVGEPLFMPSRVRSDIAAALLGSHTIPKIFFGTQPVLSLYATGRVGGLVVETGSSLTQLAPVYAGSKIAATSQRVRSGGWDVTQRYKTLLQCGHRVLREEEGHFLFEDIKIATAELSIDPTAAQSFTASQPVEVSLPDGTSIQIGSDRFEACEVLFGPPTPGRCFPGLTEAIKSCVMPLDADLQRHLCKSVCLAGGNSKLKGFPERLAKELLAAFAGKSVNVNVSNKNRSFLAWQGASLISHLSSFGGMWVSKQDFEDQGDRIFLIKGL